MASEQISFGPELNVMASEQNSLGPEINHLNFPDSSAKPLSFTHKELETLFVPLFDDTIVNRPSEVSPNSAAHLDQHQVPDTPQQTTITVERDGPLIASSTTAKQTVSNSRQSAEDSIPISVPQTAEHDPKAFFKRSLTRLHRLNSFLTLLSRLHAIWILLTCEIITIITLRHNIGFKWIWKKSCTQKAL